MASMERDDNTDRLFQHVACVLYEDSLEKNLKLPFKKDMAGLLLIIKINKIMQ